MFLIQSFLKSLYRLHLTESGIYPQFHLIHIIYGTKSVFHRLKTFFVIHTYLPNQNGRVLILKNPEHHQNLISSSL